MLVLTLYGALVVFVVVVFGVGDSDRAASRSGALSRPRGEPFILAFSTASSEAALPLALENMEAMGVPQHIVGFRPADRLQLQPGRQHAVSFAGFACSSRRRPGVHMAFSQQLLMMLTLMLTSKGVAAVPRASLVILSGTLATSAFRSQAWR